LRNMTTFYTYRFTKEELTARANKIASQQFSTAEQNEMLIKILGMIDLTTLEGSDTDEKITSMCGYGSTLPDKYPGAVKVAAVCVYSPFIATAKKALEGTGIEVATVAGGFPSGQLSAHLKFYEVAWCASQGADEIDVVISRRFVLSDQMDKLHDEIDAMKGACGSARLKVILETGELETVQNIRLACEVAINAGADFLKTSTGKIQPAATPEAFLIMLDTIKEYYAKTGKMIGIKPAGGIADPETAIHYYLMVKETLGEQWLNKNWFRIGASRLVGKIVERL
jgi:deoxyribose-phosphate aldolase